MHLFFSYPFLSASLISGATFYGSIFAYTVFDIAGTNFKLVASSGAILGSVVANIALTFLGGSDAIFLVEDYYGAFLGAAIASNFWAWVVVGSWIVRDRKRGPIYGTLQQSYLEAAADGIMIANLPLSCFVVGGVLCSLQVAYGVVNAYVLSKK